MTNQELTDIRVRLYKATPLKLQLVDELIELVKHSFTGVFSGVEVSEMSFVNTFFKLGELQVKMIEIDPQEIGGLLIHWYPNFRISTQSDPYCSAYMLTPREIRRIIKKVSELKDHYNSHQPK